VGVAAGKQERKVRSRYCWRLEVMAFVKLKGLLKKHIQSKQAPENKKEQ
jgi:hypothetical protein